MHRNIGHRIIRLNPNSVLAGLGGKRAQSDIEVTTSSGLVATSFAASSMHINAACDSTNDPAGRSSLAAYQTRRTGFAFGRAAIRR